MTDKKILTLSISPPRNPTTLEEWQNAVDAAEAMRILHAARLDGFVTGGPEVDIERCSEILERGRQLGVFPRPDVVDRFVQELNGADN